MRVEISRILLFLILCVSNTAFSQDGFEEISYESLLRELKTKDTRRSPVHSKDFFGSTMIHAGVGIITSQMGIEVEDDRVYRRKNGFQLAVAIDLLSPEWQLEGAVRNYGQRETADELYRLREFDLKIVHAKRLPRDLGAKFGLGLAARYLNYEKEITAKDGSQVILKVKDSTPSLLATMGFDYFASRNLSLGVDFNARSSLIADTSDRFAVDMTFRMDTHF